LAEQSREVSRREERALRILDAASALILRWGYQKTTLDDISREAGVAKATIYLHWKTREELFAALMRREKVEMTEEIMQYVATDPQGATMAGMFKYSALVMLKRPLIKAVFLQDMGVIGKQARREHSTAAYAEQLAGFNTYLELLREQGLVRTDLSLRVQGYMMSAIFAGFFFIAPLMPEEYMLSDEEIADMIAETIHCTIEAGHSVPSEKLQAVSHNFMQYMERYVSMAREKLQREMES
jgi:AcrR family transcriptional regulator